MTRRFVFGAIVLAGCAGTTATMTDDSFDSLGSRHAVRLSDEAQPPEPARFERRGAVRYHMARHFDDLHVVEQLLVANKLDDARARAFMLTKPATDPGMDAWEVESKRVTVAAIELTKAPGIPAACRAEARVAEACAECHAKTQKLPVFAPAPRAPAEDATIASKMARHQWAVDRLWEGMVGASDGPWYAGLEILAKTPAPWGSPDDDHGRAKRLRDLATAAQTKRTTETLHDRAVSYGEMMTACANCHATLDKAPRPSALEPM